MRRRPLLLAGPSGAALGLRRALGLLAPACAGSALAQHAAAPAPRDAEHTDRAEVRPRALVFPRDFGAHPEFRTEWWYATGLLDGEDKRPRFGFQLTFFRSRTDLAADNRSRFAARQLLFAHAALSDLREGPAGRFVHAQRIARWSGDEDARLAVADTRDTRVRIGDWRFAREGDAGRSVYRATLADRDAGFGFEFTLAATQPVLLQGEAGFSRKGPEAAQASHYYSQPQLAVQGRLVHGAAAQAVQGRAWLDHEWSESLLHPQAVGWDWTGMNLDDGAALTVFRLRRADGSALWAGGSFRASPARGGGTRDFGPDEVRMTPGRRWTSPASRASYPVQWRIVTPAGEFELRALADAQELDSRGSTGSIYWEGASELLDAQGRRIGAGYLEMTGYAGRLRL